jgi:Tol biopolymer transport system component
MRASAIALAELLCVSSAIPSAVRAQATTTRVSVDSSGAEGVGGDSYRPSISGDGRYVAFESWCTNLVAGDTNGHSDIFVRDLVGGSTTRVNLGPSGAQAFGADSHDPAISADGRHVAFDSGCANLVVTDANPYFDVFVRDVVNGTTTLVNVDSSGIQGAGGDSLYPAISADGRYVAFKSWCVNLVAADNNGHSDVFVRDLVSGVTTLASVDSNGVQQNNECSYLALSGDGRYVAFASTATNLVIGDTNTVYDIFLRDLLTGVTTRESVDSAGVQGNSNSAWPSISSDGRFLAFHSTATNLVTGDANGTWDIFVRDTHNGLTTRASVDSAGLPGNSSSTNPSISADGRFVSFRSSSSNLVSGDSNGWADVFVHDRLSGITTRASVSTSGAQSDNSSVFSTISNDGRYVALDSFATTLVAADTNQTQDVFVHDRGAWGPTVYCSAGTTTNGCAASITASGLPSASISVGFTLTVSSVEGQKTGLLFYGVNHAGFSPSGWGLSSSYLCVRSPIQRTGAQSSGGTVDHCDGSLTLGWNAFNSAHIAAFGAPLVAGQHVFAQGWFRDPPSPKGTMLSNAIEFILGP